MFFSDNFDQQIMNEPNRPTQTNITFLGNLTGNSNQQEVIDKYRQTKNFKTNEFIKINGIDKSKIDFNFPYIINEIEKKYVNRIVVFTRDGNKINIFEINKEQKPKSILGSTDNSKPVIEARFLGSFDYNIRDEAGKTKTTNDFNKILGYPDPENPPDLYKPYPNFGLQIALTQARNARTEGIFGDPSIFAQITDYTLSQPIAAKNNKILFGNTAKLSAQTTRADIEEQEMMSAEERERTEYKNEEQGPKRHKTDTKGGSKTKRRKPKSKRRKTKSKRNTKSKRKTNKKRK
jgi:hypothetical protein